MTSDKMHTKFIMSIYIRLRTFSTPLIYIIISMLQFFGLVSCWSLLCELMKCYVMADRCGVNDTEGKQDNWLIHIYLKHGIKQCICVYVNYYYYFI